MQAAKSSATPGRSAVVQRVGGYPNMALFIEIDNVSKTFDGIIFSWNPAAERLYGYSAAEANGRGSRIAYIRNDGSMRR